MATGDQLRQQVLTTIGNLEELQQILHRGSLKADEVVSDILLINLGGGSNSHHVSSAGRLSPGINLQIEVVIERVAQIQKDLTSYYRDLGGLG